MRILHVFDHSIPFHSGYALRTRSILEHQRALGLETFHVTSAKHPGARALVEEVDGYRFFRTPAPANWIGRIPLLKQYAIINSLAKRLGELVEEIRPDILHAHSPALNGFAALRVAQWHSLPVVYECRAFWEDAATHHGTSREGGLRYDLTRGLETYVFSRAHAITTICDGLKNDIIARGIGAEKITVVPNAVDVRKFRFNLDADLVMRKEMGLAGNKVLGFIGSFYGYEGLGLLLESLPLMMREYPGLRLLLVGGGPQENHLKALAQRLGLTEQVIFAGWAPHEKIHKYYEQIDILVYPRLPMRLTDLVTPLKPLEAMAQGRLIVASDVGGHREMMIDGCNGRLFKAGDQQDLVRVILDLLASADRWAEFRSSGRAYVEKERNWASSVVHYRDVYASLHGGN